jgi:hypothetical protein
MASELPESILSLGRQVAELHRAHPTAELTEVTHLMTAMLDIAVHGDTWARPESPQDVWLGLLAEVAAMQAAM